MSNAVFPALPGLAWNIVKTPRFKTLVQPAVSGREVRGTYQPYPTYKFTLPYEFLRDLAGFPEADTLAGFYLSRQGSFDSFLYADFSDNAVTDMAFGVGDGSTTQFQLTRAFGAGGFTFPEPVQNINALTNIKVAGVAQTIGTQVTVDGNGLATFATAPTAGQALTWTGTFYYRCRFAADNLDFTAIFSGIWESKKVEFIGAPGNRV